MDTEFLIESPKQPREQGDIMNVKEKALLCISLGSMGAMGFAWSAPTLNGATIASGWIALTVAVSALVVLASGRVSA